MGQERRAGHAGSFWERWSRGLLGVLVAREAFGSAGHMGFWECWSRGKLVARAFGSAGRAGFWERWSRGKLLGALGEGESVASLLLASKIIMELSAKLSSIN